LQAAVSVSHYNLAQSFTASTNDIWGLAIGARYKVSPQTAIIVDYTQPFTDFDLDEFGRDVNPEAGISFGVEFATSSHTFQIFATNLKGIVPQENYVFNATTPPYGQKLMIGFNITRNYNF
jgi:hypothetical protein